MIFTRSYTHLAARHSETGGYHAPNASETVQIPDEVSHNRIRVAAETFDHLQRGGKRTAELTSQDR